MTMLDDETWPLERPVDDVLRDVLDRGRRRLRIRRAAIGALTVTVLSVVSVLVVVQPRDDASDIRTTDRPEQPTDTSPLSTTVPPTSAPELPASSTSPPSSDDRPPTAGAFTHLFDDPAGDVEPAPVDWPQQADDPALDLLGLDVTSDERHLVFRHTLAGSPAEQPAGSHERGWEVRLRVPGHESVIVFLQTFPSGSDIGFYVRGAPQVHRCIGCSAELDGPGHRATVRVDLDELNAVSSNDGGGTIGHGTELTGFAARSYRVNTSRKAWSDPGYYANGGGDATAIVDVIYRIP